jgi:hypothetical protein
MASVEIIGADVLDIDLAGQPPKVNRAFVRAANRSIKSGRTVMVRLIAGDTGLKQKDVREAIRLQEASAARPEARMDARAKRIALIKFGAKGPMPSRGRGKGVSYKLNGSRGRIENAFLARTRRQDDGSGGDHLGVFVRAGRKRLPIKEKFGPSIGQVFSKYRAQGVARTLEVFDKNFDHEMDFIKTGGLGAEPAD